MKKMNLPYSEINLDIHPQYREYMVKTTKLSTVPQIFFNSKHIGGNDSFQKLVESGDIKQYIELIENNESDEETPEEPNDISDLHYDSIKVVCEQDPLYPLVQEIRKSLSIKNRTYHLKKIRKLFCW